eukprot:3273802-Rhodomonas_salina.1
MSSRQLDTKRRTLFLTLGGPQSFQTAQSQNLSPPSSTPSCWRLRIPLSPPQQPSPGCQACGVSSSCSPVAGS